MCNVALKPYTVLLFYGDMSTSTKDESYLAHVDAIGPDLAVDAARDELRKDNAWPVDDCPDDELQVVAVFEGHLTDLCAGGTDRG